MNLHPAYVAGFFDGEGCVSGMTTQAFKHWRLTFAQTDRTSLEAILLTYPGGHIQFQRPNGRFKSNGCYYLVYNSHKGIPLASSILPFTIVKHDALVEYLKKAQENSPV